MLTYGLKEISAGIGALGVILSAIYALWRGFGKTLWSLYMFAKRVERFSEISEAFVNNFTREQVERLAKLADDIPADLTARLDSIIAQLKPNGGSTLADSVNDVKRMIANEHTTTRSIISLTGSPFWESDSRGLCTFASVKLGELMGLAPSECLGNGWITNLHNGDRARLEEEWESAVEQQRKFSSVYRFVTRDGINKVKGTAIPIMDATGQVHRWIGVLELLEQQNYGSGNRKQVEG